jgi:hypothetical protein
MTSAIFVYAYSRRVFGHLELGRTLRTGSDKKQWGGGGGGGGGAHIKKNCAEWREAQKLLGYFV